MKKVRQSWGEDRMKEALDQVCSSQMTIREASERFGVPKSTLGRRAKDVRGGKELYIKPKMGNTKAFSRTFTDEQETSLYNHVKSLDSQLMPLSKKEFLSLAYKYAEKLGVDHRFNKDKKEAGKDFFYDFMKRFPDISLRTAEATSLQRAAGFNREQVDRFFDKLTDLMDKFNFSPSKIFNADETGVTCVHTDRLKVMSIRGKKQVGKLTSAERGRNVTVLLAVNASGDNFIPPLFVFPRVRIDNELKKDAPDGSIFDGQPSGWITKDGFLKWLVLFVERVNPTAISPALLIVDGHSSHKDLDVITFAKQHFIHMLSLPPHTSHKMQPLDRAIMKPFKNAYHEACSLWMRKYPNIKISLRDIASLVNTAFSKICRMELAKSGFKCSGIYPLNRNIFSDLDFAASLAGSSLEISAGTSNGVTRPISGLSSFVSSPTSSAVGTELIKSPPITLPRLSSVSLTGPSNADPKSSTAILPAHSPIVSSTATEFELTHTNTVTPAEPTSVATSHGPSNTDLTPTPIATSPDYAARPSTSQTVLEEISPLPSSSSVKYLARQNRSEKSEILTSTPYKEKLEKSKEDKEIKASLANSKRLLREEKRKEKENKRKAQCSATGYPAKQSKVTKKNPRKMARRNLNFEDLGKNQSDEKGKNESVQETQCIICGESFDEDWIQCSSCKGWSHEDCAELESNALFYECDICVTKRAM